MLSIRQISLRKSFLINIYIALTIYLILLADFVTIIDESLSSLLKIVVLLLMVYYIILNKTNKYLLAYVSFLTAVLLFGLIVSFDYNAASQEFVRYLFPIIFLLFGYAVKDNLIVVVRSFTQFMILSNIIQIVLYVLFITTSQIYLSNSLDFGIILRGSGLSSGVTTFGFLNFIAYLLHTYLENKKLSLFFLLFVLLSFSLKIIIIAIIILSIYNKTFFIKIFSFILILVIIGRDIFQQFIEISSLKFAQYILVGESARSESYRVMFDFLKHNPFLGYGLGSFGGPASIKYNSPIYEQYNFDWYGLTNLATTDTFFPHVIVELGIIGGILYFFLFFLPLVIVKRKSKKSNEVVKFILFTLFVDSMFSYGMNSQAYLISIIFIFGLLMNNDLYYNSIKLKEYKI